MKRLNVTILNSFNVKDFHMDTTVKKSTWKKVLDIIYYIFLGIFLLLAIVSVTSRITNGKIGNTQFLVVASSSMDGEKQEDYSIKTIPVKSLIAIDLVKDGKEEDFYSQLKKGDVLTFNYVSLNNVTITHRIISDPVKDSSGVYKFELRGDAVEESEIQTVYSDGRTGEILGKVTYVSLPLGQIYFFIASKLGTMLLVVLPCSLIAIIEICRIIRLVSEQRNKKKEEKERVENEAKDKEIEELKRQLMEANKNKSNDEQP